MIPETKQSVEEVWAKLKAQGPTSKVCNLIHRCQQSSGRNQKEGGRDSWDKNGGMMKNADVCVRRPREICLRHVLDEGELEAALQKEVQAMRNGCVDARREAMETIQASLMGGCKENLPPAAVLQVATAGFLTKMFLKRFEDVNDCCREIAVNIVIELLKVSTDAVLPTLAYAIPVIEHRTQLGEKTKSPIEQNEEIRYKLFQLARILTRYGGKALLAYGAELKSILEVGCQDSYHKINMESCSILLEIDGTLGDRLHQTSKEFVAMTMPLTTHKRQKVRIAAIDAVKALMHRGAHEMILEITSFIHPNVVPVKAFYGEDLKVNFCGKLATDNCQKVRLHFLLMVGDWMLNLRERLDHESRLIPYVLSALNDECGEVSAKAVEIMHALGAQYEIEHKEDLKDALYYLPQEAHGLGWGSQEAICSIWEIAAATPGHDMLKPFQCRPHLGTRIMVQANFSRMIRAIKSELMSWQSEIRIRTMQLLRSCLLLIEDYAEQWIVPLLDAVCQVAQQDGLFPFAVDCCFIMGCFVSLSTHLNHLLPSLMDDMSSAAKTANLWVTSHILKGSAHRKDNSNQIQRLISCLDSPTLHDTRDTKIAQAHFTCICSIAELKGENERVPCMMKLVPLLFKACTNVALSSCNSSDCIRMLLKHLQRLVKNADTDLRTIMCNQRSRIIKQARDMQPMASEHHTLLIAWIIVPCCESNLINVLNGKIHKVLDSEGERCDKAEMDAAECQELMTIVKEAMDACKQHPKSLTQLLAAISIVLSQQRISRLNQEYCRKWLEDCLQIAWDVQDDTCLLGLLKCLENMGAHNSQLVPTTKKFVNLITKCLEHKSPAIRTQCCNTLEKAFSQATESCTSELFSNSDIINALCARLDDSRESVRQGAVRTLNSAINQMNQIIDRTDSNGYFKDRTGTSEVAEGLGALVISIRQEISRKNLLE